MENELDLNLDELDQVEASADKKLQVKNRFQQLANDKRALAQEKEAIEKAKAEAEAKAVQLEREREFYKSFNQLSSRYPEAANYQDQILERVNKGYDVEEATLGLLAKEGKLGGAAPQTKPISVSAEGGSATNNITEGEKPLNDMTEAEKFSQLQEMEKSGELLQALRAGINRQ